MKTIDGGHERIETRRVQRTLETDQDVPEPWLDCPGVRFAARITRDAMFQKDGRERETEIAYLISNLPPERAEAETLLALSRGYWGAVENGIQWVRDVVLGEDASRIRPDMLPRVMAAFANLAISILRLLGVRNIKRTMRQLVYEGGATSVAALLLPC